MTTSEFQDSLSYNLQTLSYKRVVDFALNICKELLPDYKAFEEKHRWGDSQLLEEAIAKIEGRVLTAHEIKQIMQEVDEIIPNTDSFQDFDCSYALNASAAVLELLEYLIDSKEQHIINISTYSTDTIDFKLYESDKSLGGTDLLNHPVLQNEMARQLELTKNNGV